MNWQQPKLARTGEGRLLVAVIASAVHDAQLPDTKRDCLARRRIQSAKRLLRDDFIHHVGREVGIPVDRINHLLEAA